MKVYLGSDVLSWVKNQSEVERRHLAAEHIAKVNANREHPHWLEAHPEHASAVLGMRIAHEMMESGNSYVQLNEDGSVKE